MRSPPGLIPSENMTCLASLSSSLPVLGLPTPNRLRTPTTGVTGDGETPSAPRREREGDTGCLGQKI